MKFKYLLLSFFSLCFISFSAVDQATDPPFLGLETKWADSIHAQMSLDEKIGQLFNVAAYSNKGEQHRKEVVELIEKHHVGGLTFFQGGPMKQAQLTNLYQEKAKVPLMIAIDGEWGLAMRLDSTVKYPWQMTLGAIQDDSLIYQMGLDVAEQFKRLGVHVNFAPVIDVNNNPKNPVINARSFGEQKQNVARKGIAYMKGMQDGGILANAKHFPGHGDTDADSHVTLPVVKHPKNRIDSLELFPFKQLIHAGVGSMMTAHLYLPAYTKKDKKASSLKPEIVDTLLKQSLGFKGLIFTDGLNMGGVARYQSSEENDLDALLAGNDILLLSQDVPKAIDRIKTAVAEGRISMESIDASSLKVLRAKEWLGLNEFKPIVTENLIADLNQPKYYWQVRKMVEASLSLVRNTNQQLPIRELNQKRILSIAFTDKGVSCSPFQNALNKYAQVDTLVYTTLPVSKQKELMDSLLGYDHLIVSIHKSNKNPWKSFEVDTEIKNFINILRRKKAITLDVFANAYALQDFLAAEFVDGLIVSYQNSVDAQELSAQLIFGAIQASGKLPVSSSRKLKAGLGEKSVSPFRIKYTFPEELGIKDSELAAVDQIVQEGIEAKAFPGAQVYIAKEGKVIYSKHFGNPIYESSTKVKESDLYDLASVTKISSSLLALMKLEGEGKISLEDNLGKHLKMTKGTPYEDLVLRDILAHQAGLAAWIPFYNKTLVKGKLRTDIYGSEKSEKYQIQVADNLYMIPEYRDTIFYRILNRAKVNPKKEYRYSDVGYYFMKEIIEKISKQSIEDFNQENFYGPMGMNRTTFKPLDRFSLDEIMPTENDKVFRKQLIHGYVHDPGAAMLGGIGGHAGLFSNANDLGKLMQMYLDDGNFAGESYLKSGLVETYAKCQFCLDSFPKNKKENRRGAGFDKPAFHGNPGPTCDCISFNSFGHSGFTGTYAWVDPDEKLVYVFLSNRVYPDAKNKKLLSMNIRTRIQEKIYDAISNEKYRSEQASLNRLK